VVGVRVALLMPARGLVASSTDICPPLHLVPIDSKHISARRLDSVNRFSARRSPTSHLSPISRCRWGRSMPARPYKHSPTPSLTPFFNVLFGSDLAKFVREGTTRGAFEGVKVVTLLTGDPEYLDSLKDDAPEGRYVTGYPWYLIKTPEHVPFLDAYRKRFDDYPRIASLVGYTTIKALAAGIVRAGSTDTEALIKAFEGLEFTSPAGPVSFRAIDHQSTLALYVGTTALKDGRGVMTSYEYLDGGAFQPSNDDIRKMRAAASR
jgi:Periplasmic binding protein